MRATATIVLALTLLLVSLSSYLRLDHSGIGCTPWPECYGNIGVIADKPDLAQAYERLLADASQPMAWARPLHRLVAGVLGLLVVALTAASVFLRRHRLASFLLLALTVLLAWLGIYSEGLHNPAVVMGNLSGGFAMLGVAGWMVFRDRDRARPGAATDLVRMVSGIAIVLLALQIFVGGLTSANFAASVCATLPDCHGSWFPGPQLWAAFDLSRSVATTDSGFVIGGAERSAIHILHRLMSLATLAAVLMAGVLAVRADERLAFVGVLVCVAVVIQMLTGAAAISFGVPISVAVSHNWIAAVLMLGLLRIHAACHVTDAAVR